MSNKISRLHDARKENKTRISAYRNNSYCIICGKTHDIEFHRVEDVIKLHDAVRRYPRWERVKEILDACIPVCPDCHKMLENSNDD